MATQHERAVARDFLAYTDRYMTRAFEDACDAGEIDATQLPQATRDRLAARKAARLTLAS